MSDRICHEAIVDADGDLEACNNPATGTAWHHEKDGPTHPYPACNEHKED